MSRAGNFFRNLVNGSQRGQAFRFLLGLLVVGAFGYHEFSREGFSVIERLELMTYDMRLRATMPRTIDPRVVIVDIDEKSLAAEGRFPWNRKKMALLVSKLFDDYRIKVTGFDILFAEPDESSGLKQLEELSKRELAGIPAFHEKLEVLRPGLDYDREFAMVLRKYPVVLSYAFTNYDEKEKRLSSGVLPRPWLTRDTFQGVDIHLDKVNASRAIWPSSSSRESKAVTSARCLISTASFAACRCCPNTKADSMKRYRWRSPASTSTAR